MSTKFDRNQRWGIDNEVFDSKRLKRVVAVVGLPVGFDWRWKPWVVGGGDFEEGVGIVGDGGGSGIRVDLI